MTAEQFNRDVIEQFRKSYDLLCVKSKEYCQDENDRFYPVKLTAQLTENTIEKTICNLWAKQLVGIFTMASEPLKYTKERWEEKITDSINYNFILSSLIKERFQEGDGFKIYLAGGWFTPKSLKFYERVEKLLVDFCSVCDEIQIFIPRHNKGTPKEVFDNNVKALNEADMVISLVEEKDCGTSWEIGYAYVLKKPIYLVGSSKETFTKGKTNLMLAKCGTAISVKDLIPMLENKPYEQFTFDEWEVIE